jgi:hypothetical protein
MDNFNLKKYLAENKITANSKILNEAPENLDISGVRESKKSYYHLQQSEDGRFNQSSTIAWIESNTSKEERIKLADYYTNGQFTEYPGFYQLIGPIETPDILSL